MQWEYLRIKAVYSNWPQLLAAGLEGWELVCETFDYWVFKKALPPTPNHGEQSPEYNLNETHRAA